MSSSLSFPIYRQDERSGQAASKKDKEYIEVAMYLLWTSSYQWQYMIQKTDNCGIDKCDQQSFSTVVNIRCPISPVFVLPFVANEA
jgi:hypothetical protein